MCVRLTPTCSAVARTHGVQVPSIRQASVPTHKARNDFFMEETFLCFEFDVGGERIEEIGAALTNVCRSGRFHVLQIFLSEAFFPLLDLAVIDKRAKMW